METLVPASRIPDPCPPAPLRETHGNYQQMADSHGARDASLTTLLPGWNECCHHLVTRYPKSGPAFAKKQKRKG